MDLKHKVAFITGAAQGLGKAFAEALLQKGSKVFFGDVNPSVGSATYNELSQKYGSQNVRFSPFDVTDLTKFTEVFNQAVSEFGHVDIMVNNAGIMNEVNWEPVIQIDFTAVVHGTRLAVENMRKDKGGQGGRIINISSNAGLEELMAVPVYCGVKHAVRAFTSSIAMQPDVREQGVQCAILCPHATDTPMAKSLDNVKVPYLEQLKLLLKEEDILPPSSVAEGFLELLLREDMNGCILLVEKTGKTYKKMVAVDVDK